MQEAALFICLRGKEPVLTAVGRYKVGAMSQEEIKCASIRLPLLLKYCPRIVRLSRVSLWKHEAVSRQLAELRVARASGDAQRSGQWGTRGPLARLALGKAQVDNCNISVMLLSVHNAICDGWSANLLIDSKALVLASWSLVWSRATGHRDLLFGAVFSGREAVPSDLLGCTASLMPLRVRIDDSWQVLQSFITEELARSEEIQGLEDHQLKGLTAQTFAIPDDLGTLHAKTLSKTIQVQVEFTGMMGNTIGTCQINRLDLRSNKPWPYEVTYGNQVICGIELCVVEDEPAETAAPLYTSGMGMMQLQKLFSCSGDAQEGSQYIKIAVSYGKRSGKDYLALRNPDSRRLLGGIYVSHRLVTEAESASVGDDTMKSGRVALPKLTAPLELEHRVSGRTGNFPHGSPEEAIEQAVINAEAQKLCPN
eukprot:g4273.t1